MIWLTVISIICVFTYIMWRRYSQYNQRQLMICKIALEKLLHYGKQAGENKATLEILLNAAIDTYNESLRGPWFYTNQWKISRHKFEVKKNETERDTERRHSDSESDISEG